MQVTDREIELRLRLDNPWWQAGGGVDAEYRELPRRAYLPAFDRLVREAQVRRAVVLLGPRRRRAKGTVTLIHGFCTNPNCCTIPISSRTAACSAISPSRIRKL